MSTRAPLLLDPDLAPRLAYPGPGTFSIVARDPETGLAVAVQVALLSAGRSCWPRRGWAPVATQSSWR